MDDLGISPFMETPTWWNSRLSRLSNLQCQATKDWNILQVLATLKTLPFGLRFRVASHSKQTCALHSGTVNKLLNTVSWKVAFWLRQVWHRGLSEVEHGLNVQSTLLAYFVLCSHKSGLHNPHRNTLTCPKGNIFRLICFISKAGHFRKLFDFLWNGSLDKGGRGKLMEVVACCNRL